MRKMGRSQTREALSISNLDREIARQSGATKVARTTVQRRQQRAFNVQNGRNPRIGSKALYVYQSQLKELGSTSNKRVPFRRKPMTEAQAKKAASARNAADQKRLLKAINADLATESRMTRAPKPATAVPKPAATAKSRAAKPAAAAARTGAPKAAKPATSKAKSSKEKITDQKAANIVARVNNVTANAANKTGVKRLNSIEVGQRAKSFLTRKAGGIATVNASGYQQQQSAIKGALKKPTRYSTQKANRNKPTAYNSLGQDTIRRKQQAAASIERNNTGNSGARDTARNIRAAASKQVSNAAASQLPAPKLATNPAGTKAPDNARTRANRLRTAQNLVKYRRTDPDSKAFSDAVKSRNTALAARTKGTGGRVNFRSKGQAVSRQNYRANDVTGRVRENMRMFGGRPGNFSKQTGAANGTAMKRTDTGMRQPSLFGPATKLYSTKTVKVKRKSGKRKP